MKVFVIPTWHPTKLRPLWANWILPHIEVLQENGVEAYVLQLGLDDEPIPENSNPWGQPIRLLGEKHLYVPVPRATKRYQQTRFFYGAILRKYVRRLRDVYRIAVDKWGKPDILHAHVSLPGGYLAACLGHEFRIPVIVQEHYSGFESNARFWWRNGCFVRKMSRHIQGFYAVSPGFAERIARTGLINVTGVLPNPVDTELFCPLTNEKPDHSFKAVTTGNVGWIKGTDILFEAFRSLSGRLDWSLTLFGETGNREEYSKWLNDPKFSARVTLPGKVSQEELVKAYSSSHLYVVSSRIETANVSMLQAMACGVPAVTTRCGGPETLIDDSVGLAVESDNSEALASAILEVARNRERYDPVKLRQFVEERYSKPAVAKRVLQAYQTAKSIRL